MGRVDKSCILTVYIINVITRQMSCCCSWWWVFLFLHVNLFCCSRWPECSGAALHTRPGRSASPALHCVASVNLTPVYFSPPLHLGQQAGTNSKYTVRQSSFQSGAQVCLETLFCCLNISEAAFFERRTQISPVLDLLSIQFNFEGLVVHITLPQLKVILHFFSATAELSRLLLMQLTGAWVCDVLVCNVLVY